MNHLSRPIYTDEFAERLVLAVPRLVGCNPRSSMVLVVVDGRHAGPSLRSDLPYRCEDLEEWARHLLSLVPSSCDGGEVVVLCFEDSPHREPEWFRRVFLALADLLRERGMSTREMFWVSTPLTDPVDTEVSAEHAWARDARMAAVPQSVTAALTRVCRPSLELADRLIRHQPGAPCRPQDSDPFSRLSETVMDRVVHPAQCMSLTRAVMTVEASELLISRPGGVEGLAELAVRTPGVLGIVVEALISPLGVELLLRTALEGRRSALHTVRRRFWGAGEARGHVGFEARELAASLIDGPLEPGDHHAWAGRLPDWDAGDGLRSGEIRGEEGRHCEALATGLHNSVPGFAIRSGLAIAGFLDLACGEIDAEREHDLVQLTSILWALRSCAGPALRRRAEVLIAWCLWLEGERDRALSVLATTDEPSILVEDPLAGFLAQAITVTGGSEETS